ncbi:DUF4282 domain-containing protein [Dehalococcoidia bacterium]|nr:DUF4282 domain-containing protein [Dehalococcoidia bacterium]MCL0097967.1 DUF4282 domain-containing protein [Dehalococcoidia bacterium]
MSKGFNFRDLFSFEVMVFPKIATVCYLLLVAISVLFGFTTFVRGIDMPRGGGPVIIVGLAMMTIGPFLIRLFFEALLVLFKVYDRLGDINNKVDKLPESADTTRS